MKRRSGLGAHGSGYPCLQPPNEVALGEGLAYRTRREAAFPYLWAVLTGKTFVMQGYAANAAAVVECLGRAHPTAAEWWREHAPVLLTGGRCFVFDADACELETQEAAAFR